MELARAPRSNRASRKYQSQSHGFLEESRNASEKLVAYVKRYIIPATVTSMPNWFITGTCADTKDRSRIRRPAVVSFENELCADHMASASHRTLYRRREDISGEQQQAIALPILPLGPLIPQVIDECRELGYIYSFFRFGWIELLGCDTIDIVEVQDG